MTRQHFIEASETLLVTEVSSHGKLYFAETPYFGTEMCTDAVLDELSDCAVRVQRLNVETFEREDITEVCARQYLFRRDHDHGIEAGDGKKFPFYVQGSAVWDEWKAKIEAEAEDDQPQVYSATREHGTLSHRVQGLSHA